MKKHLLGLTLLASLFASHVFGQASFDRLAFDLQVGPSGSLPLANTYTEGIGPGSAFHLQTISSAEPSDLIRISDFHAFTTQDAGCDVTQVDFDVSITALTGGGSAMVGESDVVPIVCGDPITPWRFTVPTCADIIDREWSMAAPIEFPASSITSSGVIQVSMTATLTTSCAPFFAIVAYQTFISVSSTPLPVELSSFSARNVGNTNLVEWVASSEIELASYKLEKSANALDFSSMSELSPKGSAETEAVYAVEDFNPTPTTYYRLKSVDHDGTVAYSKIAVVKKEDGSGTVQLSPNPASETVQLTFSDAIPDLPTTVLVINGKGQVVLEKIIQSSVSNESLDIQRLVPGLYTVQVIRGNQLTSKRLVKG